MNVLLSALLILDGLIVAAQASGGLKALAGGLSNSSWLMWWPTDLGQSWLLAGAGLERMPFTTWVSLISLAGGIALVAAGLSLQGMVVRPCWWQSLAIAGAMLSLIMFTIYLHPLYAIGIAANVAILVALLRNDSPLMRLPDKR